jgi:hypothetical protein
MGQRAPKVMKNGSCSLEPQSLPLVIPRACDFFRFEVPALSVPMSDDKGSAVTHPVI